MPLNTTTSFSPPTNPLPHNHHRAARIAGAVRLNEIQSAPIKWLWPGRIPLGRISLLVGDPGTGKSLLALDIAARVSSGQSWPDEIRKQAEKERVSKGQAPKSPVSLSPPLPVSLSSSPAEPCLPRQPGSVLLLTAEDDLADTVRPRLQALGANCDRILAIPSIPGQTSTSDVPRTFALNRDLTRLNALLDTLPDCRLLVIDPISAFLGGTNEHANSEVQNLLAPFAALARERQLAVLIVSHLRKKEGSALYRTMGSLAFVALARTAWMIVNDSENPNGRLLLPIKNNISANTSGLAYTIESTSATGAPTIHWSKDPVKLSANAVVNGTRSIGRPDDERQRAIHWLQNYLASGPKPTTEIKRAAEAHGFSYGTLRRAFHDAACHAVRDGWNSRWLWKLNGQEAQKPVGEFCAPWNFNDPIASFLESLSNPVLPPLTPDTRHPTPDT